MSGDEVRVNRKHSQAVLSALISSEGLLGAARGPRRNAPIRSDAQRRVHTDTHSRPISNTTHHLEARLSSYRSVKLSPVAPATLPLHRIDSRHSN